MPATSPPTRTRPRSLPPPRDRRPPGIPDTLHAPTLRAGERGVRSSALAHDHQAPHERMPAVTAGNPTMSLGASLRDRATLPSPLRGLVPSGGYPSRLRSLRSLRAPLAPRLAPLTAACPTATADAAFDGVVETTDAFSSRRRFAQRSSRPAPRSPRPAAPAAGFASAWAPAALRASPVPASPRTGLRTAPCSCVRTSADTPTGASGSVLRTTACGSVRTVRHSIAVAAPLRRLRRRRFPLRSCSTPCRS